MILSNIFNRFPVRKRSLSQQRNLSQEFAQVKQFVEGMSLIFHGVAWSVVDAGAGRVLCRLPPHASVASRFIALYPQEIFYYMTASDSKLHCNIVTTSTTITHYYYYYYDYFYYY